MKSIIKSLVIIAGVNISVFLVVGCATLSNNPFGRVDNIKYVSALSDKTVLR